MSADEPPKTGDLDAPADVSDVPADLPDVPADLPDVPTDLPDVPADVSDVPAPPHEPPATSAPDPRLGPTVGAPPGLGVGTAHVIAWAALAAANAYFVYKLRAGTPPAVRVYHHLFDFGQLLAVGFASATVVELWSRFGKRITRHASVLGYALLALASLGLSYLFVEDDLANFAERLGKENRAALVLHLLVVAVGLSVPVVALIGRVLRRPWFRWVGVFLALAVGVMNNRVLAHDYRAVHLFAALDAGVLAGVALGGARLPARLRAWISRPTWRALGARLALGLRVLLTLFAVATVVVSPRAAVRKELSRVDGAVVLPVISRAHNLFNRGYADVPPAMAPWFENRSNAPKIPPSSPRLLPPDAIVLLVTVDSMRASLFEDEVTRNRLPRLAAIRASSVDFGRARSPASRTLPTWGAIFTGKFYHGLLWDGVNLRKDRSPRFPSLLAKAGIPSIAFLSYGALGKNNLKGGFTEEVYLKPKEGQSFALSTEVIPKIIERIDAHKGGPLFVFAHMMDPHFPYDAAGKQGTPFERFMREVMIADTSYGQLWDAIEARGLENRTVLIVSADHGEAFGQHDTLYHTVTLYDELIRVPLFIKVPGVTPRRIEEPVSLMDLGPTIMDLYGVATPGTFLGQSLVPYLRGETPKLTRPIGAERIFTRTLVLGNRKVVLDSEKGTEEIFDLSTDPDETKNIAEELGEEGQKQIQLTRTFFETHARK